MSEFLHNLSWQALTIDNTKVNIKFDAVIELNKNIKRLIRDVDRSNIKTIEFDYATDETKDKVQTMEEQVVNNIINNVKVGFPRDYKHQCRVQQLKLKMTLKNLK